MFFFLIAAAIFLTDQVTKFLIIRSFSAGMSTCVIPGFLNFTLVRNRGSAFGLFPSGRWILVAVTVLSIAFLVYFFYRFGRDLGLGRYSLALIFGGALGNFADRLLRGYVVDFIDVYAGRFHWYAFNVADSAITIGALWLGALMLMRKGRNPS